METLARLFNHTLGKTTSGESILHVANLPGHFLISKLPPELLEIVLVEFILSGPHESPRNRLTTLMLVSKEWSALSERLSSTVTSFVPSKSGLVVERLVAELRKEMSSGGYSPCRYLHICATRSKEWLDLGGSPYLDLMKLVVPIIWQLHLHCGSILSTQFHPDGANPNPNQIPAPTVSMRLLQELRAQEIPSSMIEYYLGALPDDRPLVLTLHHDFEGENEQHLFSIPIHELIEHDPPLNAAVGAGDRNSRKFDVHFRKRSDLAQMVGSLTGAGLSTGNFRERIKVLRVWFKGGIEAIPELDSVFKKNNWALRIEWNARRPPKGKSFCYPDVCKRLYACACQHQPTIV